MTFNYYSLRHGSNNVFQPDHAPMNRALMFMVSDINVGLEVDTSLYIASDSNPMTLLNCNGMVVGTLASQGCHDDPRKVQYTFVSKVCDIRDRASKDYGGKTTISSTNPQYIINSIRQYLNKMLTAAKHLELEMFRYCVTFCGYSINSEVSRSIGAQPGSVAASFSGALWHDLNEVMRGRMRFEDLAPEHAKAFEDFLTLKRTNIEASKQSYERQKGMLGSVKRLLVISDLGIRVGAYHLTRVDGCSGPRSTSEVGIVEQMRLYADMDALKDCNPAAHTDIVLSLNDASAYCHGNGLGHRVARTNKYGLPPMPTDSVEEAGYYYTGTGGGEYSLLMDKRL